MTDEPVTTLERDNDVATVALHGEVDVLNVDQVRIALVEALETAPRTIVVDLAQLSFIDSTGLGAIIFGFQRARDEGIDFQLANPSRGVHQILVLSGLLEVVSLKEAKDAKEVKEVKELQE
ncbi:STAS domain-containing protein [Actinoplanes sp. TFC3]|uniref:STAS domain-containing protein n=1 Tax=Actinoplanes sp. TFC3 TaxID=1710355 RepID=UPI000834EB10|nr:STAS domain-containing protein [Actinoplanes sp. TFC3]